MASLQLPHNTPQSAQTSTLAAAMRRDGYVVVPELLPSAQVDEVRSALAPWLSGAHTGRNEFEGLYTQRLYALLAKTPAIAPLVEHPTLLGLVDVLLPANSLLSALIAINAHPGETPQRGHRDDSGDVLPMIEPRPWLGVSAMWAIDAFTADNGATEIVPGSHLWPHARPARESDFEPVEMPAGSLLVFLGNLIHRGGANRSDAPRLGITPQYCAPFMRQIENMVLSVPPEVARNYSERIQELLGYSIAAPGFMGYVDGVHPRRLLDPDYAGRKARGLPS